MSCVDEIGFGEPAQRFARVGAGGIGVVVELLGVRSPAGGQE